MENKQPERGSVPCGICGRPRYHSTSNANRGQLKTCTYCRQQKWRDRNRTAIVADNARRYRENAAEYQARARTQYSENPERHKLLMWHGKLRNKGASPEYYNAKMLEQGHVCAICGKGQRGRRRLDLDHSHATGTPRGIVCNPCNRLIGIYEKLRDACDYDRMKPKLEKIQTYLAQYEKEK